MPTSADLTGSQNGPSGLSGTGSGWPAFDPCLDQSLDVGHAGEGVTSGQVAPRSWGSARGAGLLTTLWGDLGGTWRKWAGGQKQAMRRGRWRRQERGSGGSLAWGWTLDRQSWSSAGELRPVSCHSLKCQAEPSAT